jgi:hypothetical protein
MPHELPEMRASHAERDHVLDVLRVAASDGRLSTEDLETRVERALQSQTLGELAALTADLPAAPAAREALVIRQEGGKHVKEGRWQVPARIVLRTQLCRVTLDFTDAVIGSDVVRIDAEMVHGKLVIVSSPGMVIDAGGLDLSYSKVKLRSADLAADARLRVELTGTLRHAKVLERRPRR